MTDILNRQIYDNVSTGLVEYERPIKGHSHNFNPRSLFVLHCSQLTLEYPGRPAREYGGDDGGDNSEFLKTAAYVLVMFLLSALGVNFVSKSVDAMGYNGNRWAIMIFWACVCFGIAIPILLFLVLGFAHP